MKAIDVQDLPEPLAQAIAEMVDSIRRQIRNGDAARKKGVEVGLPLWKGTVIGPINRREIYEDVG